MVPETTLDSLKLYVDEGFHPGGFLEAVLSNDLFKAVQMADSENCVALVELVKYIYQNTPIAAQGSKEKVYQWIAEGGLRGRQKATVYEG